VSYRIPLAVCTYGEEEYAAADAVLRSGRVKMGERVREFEELVARDYGVADAVMVSSGSMADLLAYAAMMQPRGNRTVKPGDEIIVPAVTWATQVWPVAQLGAVPVLIDVDATTLGMDPEMLGPALTPRSKAVSVAHLLGNPAAVLPIAAFCDRWGLDLIEDCCEALDAKVNGQPCGTFGRFGTFSFHFSHHISTVEGGMILCRDRLDASILRSLRSHGLTRNMDRDQREAAEQLHPDVDSRFLFLTAGWNAQPTEMAAALGLVQWGKRLEWRERRRAIAARWESVTEDSVSFLRFHFADEANPFAFPLILPRDARMTKRELMASLEGAGIETRPIVAGNLGLQPAMHDVPHRFGRSLAGTDTLHERGCYIGIHPLMEEADVEYVADTLERMR